MPKIKYTFSDGTKTEVEVSEEFFTEYAQLVQNEKRNHWTETRRHVSLDGLGDSGIELPSATESPEETVAGLDSARLKDLLTKEQYELVQKIYVDKLSMKEIADQEGVEASSVRHRLMRIKAKLKK